MQGAAAAAPTAVELPVQQDSRLSGALGEPQGQRRSSADGQQRASTTPDAAAWAARSVGSSVGKKPGVDDSDSGVMAPILVSCASSDDAEPSTPDPHHHQQGSDDAAAALCEQPHQQQEQQDHHVHQVVHQQQQQQQHEECDEQQQRASIASTLDGHDSYRAIGEAVPATRIAAADIAAGCYKSGVRYCLETWPQSRVLQALDTLLAMATMFGYTATLLLIVLLGGAAWLTSCWPLGLFVTSVVLTVLLPPAPLLWVRFQHSALVSSWRRYFRFSFVVDHKLDQDARYVFAAFPHGVFPVSELLCISLLLRMWPRLRVYSICASSTFKVPVWRHILSWTGARPATAAHFRNLLTRGSVSLVPGGIAEMFLWEEHREVIKIRDRKGFVRIAVETGTPLVPVYHFGNSALFSWVAPAWLEWVCRRARLAVGYPKGRWGTLMPMSAPLFMAIGSPIPVPRIAPGQPGYDDAVETAHARLVAGLEELYHKYKAYYGWQDRDLVIT